MFNHRLFTRPRTQFDRVKTCSTIPARDLDSGNTPKLMSAKLGEILVRENLITSQQLRETLEYQRTNGGRLGSNLVRLGFVSDDVVTAVLSRQYGVPSINLDLFQIEAEVIKLISEDVALKYAVLPVSKAGATLTLAMRRYVNTPTVRFPWDR